MPSGFSPKLLLYRSRLEYLGNLCFSLAHRLRPVAFLVAELAIIARENNAPSPARTSPMEIPDSDSDITANIYKLRRRSARRQDFRAIVARRPFSRSESNSAVSPLALRSVSRNRRRLNRYLPNFRVWHAKLITGASPVVAFPNASVRQ